MQRERRIFAWPNTQAAFILIFFLATLYSYYDTTYATPLIRNFLFPLTIAFATLSLTRTNMLRRWDGLLLGMFFLWLIIVEMINVGWDYSTYNYTIYHVMLFALVCYPLAMAADGDRRPLHMILHIALAAVTLLCVVGIVLVIRQQYIITPSRFMIGLYADNYNRLYLSMYPNTAGTLLTITILLSIYMGLAHKHLAIRIVYYVAATIMAVALALTDSRTNMLATSVGLGCLAFLLIRRRMLTRRALSWVVGGVCAVALAIGCFFAFQVPVTLVEQAAIAVQSGSADAQDAPVSQPFVAVASAEASDTPAEEADPKVQITQSRDILPDLGNFVGRTRVWNAAFALIKDDPSVLLRGTSYQLMMRRVLVHTTQYFDHLHNSFLEVLIATGLPGFLLLLAFVVLLFIRGTRLFLRTDAGTPLALRFLPVVFLSCLLVSMVESQFVLTFQRLYDPLLALVAGYVTVIATRKPDAVETATAAEVVEAA